MRRSRCWSPGRGWVIATVAALLGGVGAFAGAMVNILVGVNWSSLASMLRDGTPRLC
jgi:hypothetical protein